MDCFSDVASLHGSVADGAAGRWDCNRELRVLRDATTRSHAEEASALRRSAEEFERCALRCQMDESIALQNFLAGFHEATELRLERQRAQCSGRFDALEQRLESESGRLERLRSEIAVEARRAVREAVERMGQGAEEAGGKGGELAADDAAGQARAGMAKVGADLKAAAEAAARDIAREATQAVCADLAKLQSEVANEVARCHQGVQSVAARVEATEQSAAVAVAAAKAAESQLGDLQALVAQQCPREELRAAEHSAAEGIGNLEEATAALRSALEEAEARASSSGQSLTAELSHCRDEVCCVAKECRATSEGAESASEDVARRCAEGVAGEFGAELAAMRELLQERVSGVERLVHDESVSAANAAKGSERHEAEFDELVRAAVGEAADKTRAMVGALEESLSSVQEDLRTRTRAAAERGEEAARGVESQLSAKLGVRLESFASQRFEALEESMATLSLRDQCLSEECVHAVRRADSAWRPESACLASEMRELQHELASSTKRWKASARDSAHSLEALSASYGKLATELGQVQQQGLSHEWCIAKCMQRLQYLSMDSDAGVWLDSPEFTLGCLGPLVLRLYPNGTSRGDGRCAVGLHAPAKDGGRSAVPLRLDLSVASLSRRASPEQEEGSILWLATGFGSLVDLVADAEDLTVAVEIPTAAWASLDGSLKSREAWAPPPPQAAAGLAPATAPPCREAEVVAATAAAEPGVGEAPLLLGAAAPPASSPSSSASRGSVPRPGSAGKVSRRSSSTSAVTADHRSREPALGSRASVPSSPGRAGWAMFGGEREAAEDPLAQTLPADRDRFLSERQRATDWRPTPPAAAAEAAAGLGPVGVEASTAAAADLPAAAAGPATPGTPAGRLRPFASANPWERRLPPKTNPFDV